MGSLSAPFVYPHLTVAGGKKAIEFYKKAFGAILHENDCALSEDGEKVMHAVLNIAGARVMLNDYFDEFCPAKMQDPARLGGTGVCLHIEQKTPAEADALFERAIAAGAKVVFPIEDTFWGMRYGMLEDPFGHVWSIGAQLSSQ